MPPSLEDIREQETRETLAIMGEALHPIVHSVEYQKLTTTLHESCIKDELKQRAKRTKRLELSQGRFIELPLPPEPVD